MYADMKQCRKCWQVKDAEEFSPRASRREKWVCKECKEKEEENGATE